MPFTKAAFAARIDETAGQRTSTFNLEGFGEICLRQMAHGTFLRFKTSTLEVDPLNQLIAIAAAHIIDPETGKLMFDASNTEDCAILGGLTTQQLTLIAQEATKLNTPAPEETVKNSEASPNSVSVTG